jgi:RNA polymerase sigma factor (sigma-70 family)
MCECTKSERTKTDKKIFGFTLSFLLCESLLSMSGGDDMDETQMISQIQDGDSSLLDDLIRMHYGSVFAYCYRHTGNKDLAQDLAQDTFVKMLNGIGNYKHYGQFQNYLYVIAGNVCKDYFKKKKPIYMDELPEQPDCEDNLAEAIAVRMVIAALPFVERNVIVLRYYHNCKISDVARITHATVAVTKYRLRCATAKLRTMLEEGEHD